MVNVAATLFVNGLLVSSVVMFGAWTALDLFRSRAGSTGAVRTLRMHSVGRRTSEKAARNAAA